MIFLHNLNADTKSNFGPSSAKLKVIGCSVFALTIKLY